MSQSRKYIVKTRKDVVKVIRSVLELLVVIGLLVLVVRAWFSGGEYAPYEEGSVSGVDRGFVCVSYPGIERQGSNVAVGIDRLDSQLRALSDSGYQTVSQQDVAAYYAGEKQLPERSLLLLFEDGNREASIFAEYVMQTYNFKATILNFGDGFTKNDPKLLNAEDIQRMTESSFWEFGTSGYRMEYINVFDKDGVYLGEMTPLQLNAIRDQIGGDYDHYLMDYIRDKKRLPKESYDSMAARVSDEYKKMEDAYTVETGSLPSLYAIVNPNTGMFGHNEKVSAINEQWIYDLFAMNLNRLGRTKNDRSHSVYDLTRAQVLPYWRTNHLLMRVWSDTGQDVRFTEGDGEFAAPWSLVNGAAEFLDEEIVLTSLPDGRGLLRLKDGIAADAEVDVELSGNQLGAQSILLRMDESFETGIAVTVKDNVLLIEETANGATDTLFSSRLGAPQGETGAERQAEAIPAAAPGFRVLRIVLAADRLSVWVDGLPVAEGVAVAVSGAGYMGLRAATSVQSAYQRVPVDNIYDGIFGRLVIRSTDGSLLYDGLHGGWGAFRSHADEIWRAVTDWFITYF